jgi:nitrogen fixation-related uncharacterized protein
MIIFFLIIGLAASVFLGAVLVLVIQVRSGQLDDLDTPPMRMLGGDAVLPLKSGDEIIRKEDQCD